ncbi:MAG: hypothetical protein KAS04_04190 [Candidatus Aenigmarchaeota archaeon]|nr:hypothetical protein [Candidatus Aenigmarchaeota archaeon]
MKKEMMFKILFAVILFGNALLAVHNYLKNDMFGMSVSTTIVVLVVVMYYASLRK